MMCGRPLSIARLPEEVSPGVIWMFGSADEKEVLARFGTDIFAARSKRSQTSAAKSSFVPRPGGTGGTNVMSIRRGATGLPVLAGESREASLG